MLDIYYIDKAKQSKYTKHRDDIIVKFVLCNSFYLMNYKLYIVYLDSSNVTNIKLIEAI